MTGQLGKTGLEKQLQLHLNIHLDIQTLHLFTCSKAIDVLCSDSSAHGITCNISCLICQMYNVDAFLGSGIANWFCPNHSEREICHAQAIVP